MTLPSEQLSTQNVDPILAAINKLPRRPESNLDSIPGSKGLPIIGDSLKLLSDAPGYSQKLFMEHGPVFKYTAFGAPSVNFGDVDSARLILMNKDKNFSSQLGWSQVSRLLQRGILLRDFSDHRNHRRILQQAFKRPVLENYAAQLNELLVAGIKQWPHERHFKFQHKVKSLLLDNAAELFMGAELGPESDRLNKHFIALLNATVSFARTNFPGSSWQKGVKGSQVLRDWLTQRVPARRSGNGDDFFTTLCKLSVDPENDMSINDVIDHTVLLLFAAHDTTTSTASSLFAVLCDMPEWQERLRDEVNALNKDQLSINDLDQLPLVDQFFKEVLRRYPPIFVVLRRCINAFEYNGLQIPANTMTNVNISVLHHHPDYWTDPFKFDPARFSPERSEHKGNLFQYLPFGAGAHKCLGINFAEIQTKILLFHMLKYYRISTKSDRKMIFNHLPMPLPKDGLPMKLTPI